MAEQSKRMMDWNGFMEVRDNPISKVGIFPYLGSEIPGAEEPDRIYQVYRPAEELARQETIDSFKLMPFIDEHEILGKAGMPAERKGMQGTLGEQIYFDAPYLRGNIKIHSSAAQSLIKAGKVELSPCYGCDWVKGDGTFEGQPYQYTQRNIMGNHLALVEEGRTGPDVAVQDHRTFSLDSSRLLPMEFTPEQLAQLKALIAEMMGTKTGDEDPVKPAAVDADPEMPADEDVIVDPVAEVTPAQAGAAEEAVVAAESAQAAIEEVAAAIEEVASAAEEVVAAADGKRKPAQDKLTAAKGKLTAARAKHSKLAADAKVKATLAKDGALARQVQVLQDEIKALKAKPAQDSGLALITQVADRDALAKQVTQHVGVFDASRMTADGVAKYAVDKLGIKCTKGHEAIALDAWMQGRRPAHETIARDSGPKTGADSAHSLWTQKEGK
jgi:hypothetical protein